MTPLPAVALPTLAASSVLLTPHVQQLEAAWWLYGRAVGAVAVALVAAAGALIWRALAWRQTRRGNA